MRKQYHFNIPSGFQQLSREELGEIKGGNIDPGGDPAVCKTNTTCSGYDAIVRKYYSGLCRSTPSVPDTLCECYDTNQSQGFYHGECAY